MLSLNLLHELYTGTLDVAFVCAWLQTENLQTDVILSELFVAVLPSGHPLADTRLGCVIKTQSLFSNQARNSFRYCEGVNCLMALNCLLKLAQLLKPLS